MSDELIAGGADADGTLSRSPRYVFTPPIDIYETEDGLGLMADLPGVTPETLDLEVQDNKLTLYGRVAPYVPAEARLIHREYEIGDYLRSFILSEDVDHDRITARLSDGVLTVELPRSERSKPRKIRIETG
ncbi:MAG: Hsp20/alpha crystallin family protein [Planctomycetota bacterium]|nr:MAG: Hsp20/alpha crystallin family protein [Planctomycetota bacterium]